MPTVFLSSTSKDLAAYRAKVNEAISRLPGYQCVRMEDFGALDAQPLEACLRKVRECDLFIGILGLCHGSCPSGSRLSFTEHEYQVAVKSGQPRLIFVTPEGFSVKGEDIEDDDRRGRQQIFRRQVSEDRVRSTFSSPDELAREVVIAIYNWQQERAVPSSPPPRSTRVEAPPDCGPLIYKMCDRGKQEDDFKNYFFKFVRQKNPAPQVYILCGEERECPESLVERLTKTYLKTYADYQHEGAVVSKRVGWPEEGELTERYQRLIANLFETLHPLYEMEHEDFSPTAFTSLEPLSANSVVVLEHEVRPVHGNRAVHELLKTYLSFWDEIAVRQQQRQNQAVIVAFLWVLYPPRQEGFWNALLGRRRFDREAFQSSLAELRQEREAQAFLAPCLPLTDLTCVKAEHVMQWFSNHRIYDMKTREEKRNELFAGRECLPMADVEQSLKKIQDSFLQGRG